MLAGNSCFVDVEVVPNYGVDKIGLFVCACKEFTVNVTYTLHNSLCLVICLIYFIIPV